MKSKDPQMPKTEKTTGQVSVKLKTGLRRGNITATAGETVHLGPGLAQRLVDRGQATFTATEAKRIKAKEKVQKAATEAAKPKKTPAAKSKPDPDPTPDPEPNGSSEPAGDVSTPASGDPDE
jgi:hypothetical protein